MSDGGGSLLKPPSQLNIRRDIAAFSNTGIFSSLLSSQTSLISDISSSIVSYSLVQGILGKEKEKEEEGEEKEKEG